MISEAQGSKVQNLATKGPPGLLGQAATLPQKVRPSPRTKPCRMSLSWAPEATAQHTLQGLQSPNPLPTSPWEISESGFCFAICFSPHPSFSLRSQSGLLLPMEVEAGGTGEQCWSLTSCHMASAGHIAAFHMASQTQAVIFMKILLIPARSLRGTQGSCSDCGVFCLEEQLTWSASKARCWVWMGWTLTPPS